VTAESAVLGLAVIGDEKEAPLKLLTLARLLSAFFYSNNRIIGYVKNGKEELS
jgi:hypothetical protein